MLDASPHSARLSDLKPGDFVIVECASCRHDGLIHRQPCRHSGLGRMNASSIWPLGFGAGNATRGGKLSSRSNGVFRVRDDEPIEAGLKDALNGFSLRYPHHPLSSSPKVKRAGDRRWRGHW
jgi:hypothetical protein